MKTLKLTTEESARTGFTHKAIISYAQGDFTAAATTQSWTLFTTAAGDIIKDAARKNVTNLAITGATTGGFILGDGDDDNGYLVTASSLAGATPIAYQTGDGALLALTGGKVFTAAGALILKLTTDATSAATTAGEIHVYFKVASLSTV